MELTCSHVLCKVDDIRSAVRDFTDLGFTVEWGSTPAKAHNALIWFEQGPFIELFELPSRFALLRGPFGLAYGPAAGARLAKWARPGEGWRDVALETSGFELSGTRHDLRARGLAASRVMTGRRTRPDGQPVRYRFLTPAPAGLPFIVSAYHPPQRPAQVTHANGALGVSRVRMGVAAGDHAAFGTLVGADPWLTPEPADRTRVLHVELAGLTHPLDAAALHGAELGPAASERSGRWNS
ncbi:VOC family protein [Kitasatospora sp. NPDC058162]|uniref:VOC family protein n=1 Tax=Kitasatospora sp. NPDC058162 TaxID=3346362 RepID=UPI0036DCC1E3